MCGLMTSACLAIAWHADQEVTPGHLAWHAGHVIGWGTLEPRPSGAVVWPQGHAANSAVCSTAPAQLKACPLF